MARTESRWRRPRCHLESRRLVRSALTLAACTRRRLGVRARAVQAFAPAVGDGLPAGVEVPGIASRKTLLARSGLRLPALYVHSPQHTHSAEFATFAFRTNLGDARKFGDAAHVRDPNPPPSQARRASTASALPLMKVTRDEPGPELGHFEAQVAGAPPISGPPRVAHPEPGTGIARRAAPGTEQPHIIRAFVGERLQRYHSLRWFERPGGFKCRIG